MRYLPSDRYEDDSRRPLGLRLVRAMIRFEACVERNSIDFIDESDKSPLEMVRLPRILRLTSVSRQTIYKWERQGNFPARRKIGPNAVGWLRRDIISWCRLYIVDGG